MQCPYCGHMLEKDAAQCLHCKAVVSKPNHKHESLVTVLFVACALAFVALLVYAVLFWHDLQLPSYSSPSHAPLAAMSTS